MIKEILVGLFASFLILFVCASAILFILSSLAMLIATNIDFSEAVWWFWLMYIVGLFTTGYLAYDFGKVILQEQTK